jgi:hypothetical protein
MAAVKSVFSWDNESLMSDLTGTKAVTVSVSSPLDAVRVGNIASKFSSQGVAVSANSPRTVIAVS